MPERVQVVKLRGTYIPCNKCKSRIKCPMYHHFTRVDRYHRKTNRIQYCDIWDPT